MNCESLTKCFLYNIPRLSYTEALDLQHELHEKCVTGSVPNCLILLEHDPVITLGVKQSSRKNLIAGAEVLLANGVVVAETDRGGDITYHGPGQLVGYPIMRLREIGCGDLHGYLRCLEQCIIDTLDVFGLQGSRKWAAGVWVGDKKICSIGVAVRKWVSYHGFALNVDPIMEHFSLINPCGLPSEQITSMAELLGGAPNIDDVRDAVARSFADVFNLNFTYQCQLLS
ncbi:MAG: lipoyl(octanoyl) transferase LipB [Armatimonadetes bacterium]|nr:lipoyl(octanoyl) transferase LipB [Armatimonadota bacterium]